MTQWGEVDLYIRQELWRSRVNARTSEPSLEDPIALEDGTTRRILLATKPFAQEDPARSWFHVLSTLAILAALLTLTLLEIPLIARAGAGFLAGLVAVRMFVLYHDHQHGAILRRSRAARILMSLYGILTLNPPSPWNRSHNHHHANNSKLLGASIGSYPIMTVEAFARAGRWKRFQYALARHPLTIFMGYLTVFLYGMTLRPFLLNPRQHLDCAAALGLHGALIAMCALLDPAALLFTLGLPLFVASALGAYLFYAQHNFPDAKFHPRGEWELPIAALESSSYMDLSPLMHWMTANIGYHQVHHLNPRIPFYRLPEAMASIKELEAVGRTTLSLTDIYRCLRLKLWDPARGRMVTFSGDP
jgi:acyl-lipid omega-6 desaturase (Delta-12 desaturase)